MDLVLLELILWIGLLFFFWALKEGLGRVEADIESIGLINNARRSFDNGAPSFHRPEQSAERIGTYRDMPIFRYVVIQGRTYQFDRVSPPENPEVLDNEERCIPPGLVYQECKVPKETFEQV